MSPLFMFDTIYQKVRMCLYQPSLLVLKIHPSIFLYNVAWIKFSRGPAVLRSPDLHIRVQGGICHVSKLCGGSHQSLVVPQASPLPVTDM
jgi:hypothetical protein